MGKNIEGGEGGATSWLTVLKRAFRSSPNNKDTQNKSSRRKFQHHQQDKDEDKKTERKRWLFRKTEPKEAPPPADCTALKPSVAPPANHHQQAIAAAAVAVEIIQFKRRTDAATWKQHYAAKVIQTAFRGYIARRALIALKGIVKLQAIIRGQNVRKQAKTTMKCIQALLRVQAGLRDQRALLSQHSGKKHTFDEACNLWESKHHKDIRHRKSRSRDGSMSSIPDNWRDCQFEAILKARNEGAARPRASTGYKRESIKTVETDYLNRCSFSTMDGRRSRCQSPIHRQPIITQWPKSPQVCGMSPYCLKEEKGHSTANTPSLRENGNAPRYNTSKKTEATMPNYMVSTESVKAKIQPQSMPRQRPSTPDRERAGPAKKRLSYPLLDTHCVNSGSRYNIMGQKLRSPSFKSVQAGQMGNKERTTISPCSTMDLRRHR